MHGYIFYRNEVLWKGSSARFDILSEKLLELAHKKSIDPHSNLIQFIEKLKYHTGGIINRDLNSKKDIEQFTELAELAIKELIKEGYYNYYNHKKNGQVFNTALSADQHFIKALKEIASEWKDDNLFINRADKLKDITPTLLYFARKENIDPNSPLMKFLQKLYKGKAKDIEIHSKEELKQFIELAELSISQLINNGYFKQRAITKNGETFNYVQHNYLTYIDRLKEVANDWDNTVSDEWKQGKIVTTEENVVYKNQSIPIEQKYKPEPIIKNLLRLIIYSSLIIIVIMSILWALVFLVKFVPKF